MEVFETCRVVKRTQCTGEEARNEVCHALQHHVTKPSVATFRQHSSRSSAQRHKAGNA